MQKISVGATVGRWIVNKRIGEGGNGIVWQCSDKTGESGALKVLKSYLLQATKNTDQQVLRARRTRRFMDEIRFLKLHQSEDGIVPLIDYYLPETLTEDDPPWLVMQLGIPLLDHLKSDGITFRSIIEIFRDLAATLTRLHAKGTAHRDIKPDNILLINGKPHFSDFGLVHFDEKQAVTGTSEILGPLFFVSPEMMNTPAQADPCIADVYSFAKSLWVAASGQRFPLPGEQRLGTPALSLSAYVKDPRSQLLDHIMDKCTRHSPQERATSETIHKELSVWCEFNESPPNSLIEISQIARATGGMAAVAQAQFDEESRLRRLGDTLMEYVSDQLQPVLIALNNFRFTDATGEPLETRLALGSVDGPSSMDYDRW